MSDEEIQSAAFSNAELQSERLRILGVLAFLALLVVILLVRVFVIHTVPTATPWVWDLLLASTVAAYELWTLRRVDRALKAGTSLPLRFWVLSTVLETSIPAFVLAFLTNPQIESAYRPLASSSLLIFFIFIILSIFRLSPRISALSGIVSSTTYLAAAMYLGWRPPVLGVAAPVTQTAVSLNAIALLAAGLIAAAVAREVRKHVDAALREAETKRELEAVQHDLQVARSIQQSLLPRQALAIAGFDIAGWNHPADDTGGDYFDWKTLADGRAVVSLADVTGHGIGPALLATACHAYARSALSTAGDLATALERINQDLGADLTPGRFVTFVAAVCCPDCGEVEVLSAGHGPILVYSRRQDEFRRMNAQGLPLGIFPAFSSDPPTRLHLQTGDLLLLITDGFFEWEDDRGVQFGVHRLEEELRASRDLAAAEIIQHIHNAVVRFSNGTEQQDDLTAVLIKRGMNSKDGIPQEN
jgi:serine phosphatase RsbU (regulator of sigma subunit)